MFATLLTAVTLTAASPAIADGPNENAHDALTHMAPLIGSWDIQDSSLNAEGVWVNGNGADWTFWWTLEGHAIQDLWIAPGYAAEPPEGAQRQFGTNIRRVDPATGDWEMAWLTNGSGPTLRFTATSTEDEVVMSSVEPHFTGAPSRITFFNMKENSFDWKLERAEDDETYVEIYRIRGTRKPD